MSSSVTDIPVRGGNISAVPPLPDTERKGLTKKEISADHPTWCPGCGDFSVLALYFKLIEKRKLWHEKITTIAGIGCSSRFPYFVQAHGAHYIHGRALPIWAGVIPMTLTPSVPIDDARLIAGVDVPEYATRYKR